MNQFNNAQSQYPSNNQYNNGYSQLYGGEQQASQQPQYLPEQSQQGHKPELNQPPTQQSDYESIFGQYFSYKIHGSKAAFELKPSITRKGWHTVIFEAANSIGNRQYDWNNKTIIQLTKQELPQMCGLFCGMLQFFEGNAHGPDNNKGFKAEWQGQGNNFRCFVSLMEKGTQIKGIPISPFEALQLGHIACVQYCQNFPTLTTDAFIVSLKHMAKHL